MQPILIAKVISWNPIQKVLANEIQLWWNWVFIEKKSFYFVFQVEVEVESIDKAGNFIGWLFVEGVNLSVSLVEQGLSKMHFTAERSNYARVIQSAEEKAKETKLKVGCREA